MNELVLAIASTRVASDKIGKFALQSGNTSACPSNLILKSLELLPFPFSLFVVRVHLAQGRGRSMTAYKLLVIISY
jgi:hypothetical protein